METLIDQSVSISVILGKRMPALRWWYYYYYYSYSSSSSPNNGTIR